VLEGITRSVILDLARQLPMPVQLAAIAVNEVSELAEAAISSSSRGLLPVVQVGETIIGTGQPGPYTQRLMAAYEAFVAQNVRTAIDD
jgi:branched-subunit amino acid aminotransferase/4-amino-4-deoxychorismate lyase